MPPLFDLTDPVMAAFHATVIQGGYSTPEIEAGRMKADLAGVTDIDVLVVLAEQAGLPTGHRTVESLQQRLYDHIDELLAAFEARATQEGRP